MRGITTLSAIFIAAIIIASATATTVYAHFSGRDSVDDCVIHWEEETKYDTERKAAQNAWEDLKGDDDCVDLIPDTWNTITDLEWTDVNDSEADWAGFYQPRLGADEIMMNSHLLDMESYSSCDRKSVAMHELGHAHGFAHSYGDNVMTADDTNFPCELGTHDIEDYEELWGES